MWKFLMKIDCPPQYADARRSLLVVLLPLFLVAGCVQQPVSPRLERLEVSAPVLALTYYQTLGRMTAGELAKERSALAAQPATPNLQIRQAMLLGHPRNAQDVGRALVLLDGLLKSSDPAAIELQPLARLLVDQHLERQRLDSQVDRLGVQVKETQRKAQELQEKLDSLTDIERTLTPPPRSGKGGRQ
jgi:hypothetical protein